ncbi:helix-turn-helix domain-containing protein [Paenibacillus mendelii]|uniref:Helix-turn-helix domain-containing protein n=1 Tax=Paenibacillus mendelii TaxID=206163 RepID=A0ABV6JD83_9BACL|nr:helix-turn-helix domain-containing protein [Paenibacillus mendelii]MCQ6561499.1 helix-turn-helix domain-containing protein [Paenibacillus mendelii]
MTAEYKRRKRRIIATFSASYIVLLVIPIIVSVIVYDRTVAVVKEEVVRNNMLLLEQAKSILDRRMAELDSIVWQIEADPRITSYRYMAKPFEGANTFKTWYTAKHLYDFSASNNFILDYFVLYKKSGMVLSHQNVYKSSEFSDQVFHYTDMEPAAMEQLLYGSNHRYEVLPAMEASYRGKSYPIVSYVQSLDSGSSPGAVILVLINSREIVKLLEGFDVSSGGTAFIMDGKGQTIASVSDGAGPSPLLQRLSGTHGVIEASPDTNGMLTTYTKLESKDWYFVVAQSPEIVLHKVNQIRKIIIGLSVLLVAVLVLYCLFAYRRSKPIRKLLLRIMERSEPVSYGTFKPYAMIERNYSLLEDDKLFLQRALQEQLPLIRSSFLQRLLKGDFSTETELLTLKRHAGTELRGAYYAVVITRLQSYEGELTTNILEELEIRRIMMKDALSKDAFSGCAWHDTEQDKISIILPLEVQDAEESRKQLELLLGMLQEQLHIQHAISPVFAVGGLYPTLAEISRSYEEAKQALGGGQGEPGIKILWYDRLPQERSFYYYPPDAELRLIHLTRMGALEEADAMLDDLHRTNERMNLSADMIKFLHYEMWGTVVKITEDPDLKDMNGMIALRLDTHEAGAMDLDTLMKDLRETYALIGKRIHMRKNTQKSGLKEQMIDYIESNYKRPDFSLTELANQFNMSESYLSQVFKEQVGINFIEYVENGRMKCAKELLVRTDMPIHEIASTIGYSLNSTFCRAFKRINGVSASNYRRLNT